MIDLQFYAHLHLIYTFRGKMIPSELERLVRESIDRGHRPYFVNCTCGTTVLGAFDPINPIADICEKYNLWLHIDVSVSSVFGTAAIHHVCCTLNRRLGEVVVCCLPSSVTS